MLGAIHDHSQRELMKRFFLFIFWGIGIQIFVLGFWMISKEWDLPAVLDYIVAPGMFPAAFFIDGGPPRSVIVVGFIINIGIYSLLSYIAFVIFRRIRARRNVDPG